MHFIAKKIAFIVILVIKWQRISRNNLFFDFLIFFKLKTIYCFKAQILQYSDTLKGSSKGFVL